MEIKLMTHDLDYILAPLREILEKAETGDVKNYAVDIAQKLASIALPLKIYNVSLSQIESQVQFKTSGDVVILLSFSTNYCHFGDGYNPNKFTIELSCEFTSKKSNVLVCITSDISPSHPHQMITVIYTGEGGQSEKILNKKCLSGDILEGLDAIFSGNYRFSVVDMNVLEDYWRVKYGK